MDPSLVRPFPSPIYHWLPLYFTLSHLSRKMFLENALFAYMYLIL